MRLIEFIKANLPLVICSQLQPYLEHAESLSTSSEEEGFHLGTLLADAYQQGHIDRATLLLVKKVAGIHKGSKYFMKGSGFRINNLFHSISPVPSSKKTSMAGKPEAGWIRI